MRNLLIAFTCLLFCFTSSYAEESQQLPVEVQQPSDVTQQPVNDQDGVQKPPVPILQPPVATQQPLSVPGEVPKPSTPVPQPPARIQRPVNVQNQPQQVPVPVPQPPVRTQPPAENQNMNMPQQPSDSIASDVPGNIPPAAMTPEQIKAFMSRPKEENYIILNFDNADLKDVINTVGSITNENFIISPGIDARVTIHSSKKIPVSEVMNVFESVLEANGMAVVRSGQFLKIVTGATAKQKPIEVRKGDQADTLPDVDRPVTQIVPVQYVPATEISTVLTPLLSQFGSIIPNPRNNLLIVNELSSNLIRILKVLNEIDVNAFKNTRMSFIKPKYSDVQSLTNELTEVLNALNLSREGIALVPIERINSLVVFSASPTLLKTVEGWIMRLDEEVVTGQNIFVYPVQNVKAEKIADILRTLYETGDGGKARVSAQKADAKGAAPQRTAVAPRQQQTQESGGSRVDIITFEPTNSLIIFAPPGVYREIVKTIKKIDTYPREVLIEAIVAQVTLSDSDEHGIQWSVLDTKFRDNRFFEGEVTTVIGSTIADSGLITDAAKLTLGAGATGISYAVLQPGKFAALINAMSTRGKVDILSSPRLLVRDQEEANIEVGSEIPTATSTTTSSSTTDQLTQNIQYKTVGIKLKIKPTISEDKTVVLDLEQEVSSQGENITVGQRGNTYPSFNATKAKTSIVVPDRQGIVIGGIMQEEKKKGYSGIPILSSIPILGHLFRYQNDSSTKKELVIIITPQVISTRSEGEAFTSEFLGKLKEVKRYLNENDIRYPKGGLTVPSSSNTEGTNPSKTNEP
ncbi:MAG: type II secretion system protein GspD [Nitrospiraceae bacterium]|nr:MAG: type II secretion system protein GspD [Nitrospiraceae bacterium]